MRDRRRHVESGGRAAGKADSAPAALQPCIDQATSARAESWVCTPTGLTTSIRDAAGTLRRSFTPVAPAVPARTEPPGAQPLADDYDTWCENGSICHRKISNYIEETKGNAAYGDIRGVIGTFDVVLRTNLNGRQGQWRITLIWDSGPAINVQGVMANCYEVIDFWPDAHCGDHYAGAPRIGPAG